jgi:hypothetical protein
VWVTGKFLTGKIFRFGKLCRVNLWIGFETLKKTLFLEKMSLATIMLFQAADRNIQRGLAGTCRVFQGSSQKKIESQVVPDFYDSEFHNPCF